MEKLLIVDDEIEILEWLEELFTYDFSRKLEVHTASSAHTALELLNQVAFDVVLTDIKMPGMDGIMLFEKIKENWPDCKIVFLTGYRNFEDIYKVNKNRDVRYILKSEDDDVIMQAVADALVEIKAQMEQRRMQEIQQDYWMKARYWMRREFLDHLLQHPEQVEKRYQESLGVEFDFQKQMLLFLLRLDTKGKSEEEDCFRLEQYAEHIKKSIPDWIRVQEHILEKRYLLLFIQAKETENEQWDRIFHVSQGAIETIQKMCEMQKEVGFSAVISSEAVSMKEMQDLVNRLKKIMVGYLGGIKAAVVHAEKADEFFNTEENSAVKEINISLLKHYLELHQREAYFIHLNDVCRRLCESRSRHDMCAMELYFNVSTLLLQFINDNHLQEILAFKIGLYKLLNVDEHRDWAEAGAYLILLSEEIFDILGNYENTLSERALGRIIEYIEHHIDGNLSVTKLAAVGGFNASYLSRLFKQVHNETLSDYVLKKRMESAKELLVKTQDQIQTIGEKTGYTSSNSFSRAFKSYTGLSPMEYRETAYVNKMI